MKMILFQGQLGLRNRRNLLRCIRCGREPRVTDGAARHVTVRGKRPGHPIVSQPGAGTRAIFREQPGSLEGKVQRVAATNQGISYRTAGLTSVAQPVACQGGGPGTEDPGAACQAATAGRAVPPRAEPVIVPAPDPAFELIPVRHQFSSVQVLLMVGWVLNGIPLRGTCGALNWMQEMPVKWGFDFPVPHFTTVRLWLLRVGYHKLHRPKEHAADWVWIVDHSNQIGQEKCFLILGVRLSQLPPPGPEFPLRLSQMEPIELEPVTVSDKEVVLNQLEANVAQTGVPRAIIDDHGGDLAGGVELFRRAHPETIEVYDISHKAACLLKARLEHDQQWKAFAAKAGQTKCSVQQTEWAFLIPPSQRVKARYMNLGPLIAWGIDTLAILDNPGPEVLNYGTRERLEEKLGWLRQFREPLQGWSELKQTIDVVLEF